MCASYMLRQRNPQQLGLPLEIRIDDFDQFCDVILAPYRQAPVIRYEAEQHVLLAMRFALLPSWSKEPKVKFATHNARLDTITEKPTWKTVFVNKHCLVPMTSFIEPIYHGEYAGNMVAFSEQSEETVLAAGVFDEWLNKETGEVIASFSIITHDPLPLVDQTGHDRSPVFLNKEAATEWLAKEGQPAGALKQFLLENQNRPELSVAIQRPMKPGWEKRR